MTTGFRIRIDPIACDGRGLCAEALPELITLDDWGYPIVRNESFGSAHLARARLAVRVCPKLALVVEELGTDM